MNKIVRAAVRTGIFASGGLVDHNRVGPQVDLAHRDILPRREHGQESAFSGLEKIGGIVVLQAGLDLDLDRFNKKLQCVLSAISVAHQIEFQTVRDPPPLLAVENDSQRNSQVLHRTEE